MTYLYYNIELKFGNYSMLDYDRAVRMCAGAIYEETSPFAFMYKTDSGKLVREFFHSSIVVIERS